MESIAGLEEVNANDEKNPFNSSSVSGCNKREVDGDEDEWTEVELDWQPSRGKVKPGVGLDGDDWYIGDGEQLRDGVGVMRLWICLFPTKFISFTGA